MRSTRLREAAEAVVVQLLMIVGGDVTARENFFQVLKELNAIHDMKHQVQNYSSSA